MKNETKDPRTIRILCIGASTVMQVTQNTEDTWPGILERQLNAAFLGKNVFIEIAAEGHGGHKVWQGYTFCKYELPRFDADIVITLWGINDLARQRESHYFYEGTTQRLKNIAQSQEIRKTKYRQALAACSQIYRWIRFIKFQRTQRKRLRSGDWLDWQSKHMPQLRNYYNSRPYRETLAREPDPIIEFEDGLRQQLLCLKDRKIETILLAQPVLWKNDLSQSEQQTLWFVIDANNGPFRASGHWLAREMDKYNFIQKKLADENHMLYIPLDRFIPKTLDYFFDDCHMTDKGSYAMATAIYPALLSAVEKIAAKRGLTKNIPKPL